ncbi:MAG: hypothetical protein M3020_25320, partial [Myxococcota bacterium]|nr:hypothetical protein [Myxococcota bacterium]
MAQAEHRPRRAFRLVSAWVASCLIVLVYFLLPDGEPAATLDAGHLSSSDSAPEQRLDVIAVSPTDAVAGSAVTVSYEGAAERVPVRAFAGKEELSVLARRNGALVVRLPSDLPVGRVKIRVSAGDERSKPYPLQVKTANYRKPFRNLVGGFALLIFGIGILARGARGAAGLGNANLIARLGRRGP